MDAIEMREDWWQLHADIENIDNSLVSLSVVTDPFGEYDTVYLNQCFKDVVIPFKEHFIFDLSHPLDTFVSKHHRRYARRGAVYRKMRCLIRFLDDWSGLYAALIKRHKIRGLTAFLKSSFELRLQVPGFVINKTNL